MQEQNKNTIVDGLRLIESLHTTARQLLVCSQIVKLLSNIQLPAALLNKLLCKWSLEEEISNKFYRNSKGKITDNGIATTAFTHYLDLCDSLGLISDLNGFYSNTRLGHLFLHFFSNEKSGNGSIGLSEKVIYSFQLLNIDADGILLVMDLLSEGTTPKTQNGLLQRFKEKLNNRLTAKKENALHSIKELISEKYRTVNFVWKHAEKYAEHILIPRCEWLASLGWVFIEKKGSSTIYSLTATGTNIYRSTEQILGTYEIKDINQNWLFSKTFGVFNMTFPNDKRTDFSSLGQDQKNKMIGSSLTSALKIVKTSNSFRIPLFDALLYICLEHFIGLRVVTELLDVLEIIKKGIIFDNRQFLVKEEGRINESYISMRVLK